MDYSYIVGQMTWSHTRLAAFEDCPYKFLLRYILDLPPGEHFFSGYTPFHGDNYKKEVSDFPFLEWVISEYNALFDSLPVFEKAPD